MSRESEMEGLGGMIWFIGLGGGLILLAAAMIYANVRKRRGGGDPNHAWKQAAAESGHPEVAQPNRR